jgi:hypothetical protein
MVYFHTKSPNLGQFWRALELENVSLFMTIWYNLLPFGIDCSHLVYFPVLVCLDRQKSGNPDRLSLDNIKTNIFCRFTTQ